jgi:asparagine synthase (glutamine-hydrolysing)
MCGIYGKIDLQKKSDNNTDGIKKMMIESAYRGPDSQEIKVINHVQLGFNRLAIIDLDARSNQPFERKDLGKVIVFNGEIYNYLEIKEDLLAEGYTFQTNSDTEVFLVAYHHYQEEVFNRLNGMWACCIYDYYKDIVLLSRDRYGVKPLYYMYEENDFYFASELKSLLKIKKELKLEQTIINRFLVFGQNKFSSGKTFVKNIFEHPTGSYSILESKVLKTIKFYQVPSVLKKYDLADVEQQLRDDFRSALKLRMRSDVPVALLLSGGLDSSLIAVHLNDMIEKNEIDVKKIHAFTLNFENYENNEWDLVQKNAIFFPHITCEPINVSIAEFKAELASLINQQDIPTLSISHLIHIIAQREIKNKGFTVLINGQGPDEVYGGYFPPDMGYIMLDFFRKNPYKAIIEMKHININWRYSYLEQIKLMSQAFVHKSMPKSYNILKLSKSKSFIPNPISLDQISKTKYNFKSIGYYNFRSKSQIFEKQFNGILNYEDMTSMLNSLEMRSPFLDFRIVNLGLSLPVSLYLKNGYSKWILRKALGDLLPDEICWSNWKWGYPVPKHELMSDIMPKNVKWNESSYSAQWRVYNLKKWLNFHNIE